MAKQKVLLLPMKKAAPKSSLKPLEPITSGVMVIMVQTTAPTADAIIALKPVNLVLFLPLPMPK